MDTGTLSASHTSFVDSRTPRPSKPDHHAALPTNLTSSHAKQSLLEKIGYTGDSKVDILDAAQGMESVSFDDFLGAPWCCSAPHRYWLAGP